MQKLAANRYDPLYTAGVSYRSAALRGNAMPVSLVTADVIAERLSISVQTVYRLAERRQLPAVRLGRLVRFDLIAIERLIAGQDVTGKATSPGA